MQPWRISAGLTAALTGAAFLAGGSRLEYLAPFWRLILADYGLVIPPIWVWCWPLLRPAFTVSPAPPGWPIWDGGSIWWRARSGVARAIRNSPRPYGGTPRGSGSDLGSG